MIGIAAPRRAHPYLDDAILLDRAVVRGIEFNGVKTVIILQSNRGKRWSAERSIHWIAKLNAKGLGRLDDGVVIDRNGNGGNGRARGEINRASGGNETFLGSGARDGGIVNTNWGRGVTSAVKQDGESDEARAFRDSVGAVTKLDRSSGVIVQNRQGCGAL